MAIVQFVGFDYMSTSCVAEIKRNVTALIETPEGSCPGDRSYGIPQEFIGMPPDIARNLAALSVIEKLEIYEPRVELREVTAKASLEDGLLKSIYLIGPNTKYEAESEEKEDADEE